MSQCSALVLPFPLRTSSLLVLVRRLLHLPDQRRKVKVPAAVNVCIVNAFAMAKEHLIPYFYGTLPHASLSFFQTTLHGARAVRGRQEDVEHALAGHSTASSSTHVVEYQQVVETLSANSKHEVLKNGVKLGKQLVETIEEEETAWKLLADFWSEMILYVAPSDNLEGHKEAIARGGELITLLWVMLFHAGIVSRPGEEDGAAATATSAGAV
nr:unnamed protein product [Digitaria exilis]